MGATLDSLCGKVDNLVEKVGDLKLDNEKAHAAMVIEQKATTKTLVAIDKQVAVAKTKFKTHVKACEIKHGALNKKLWAFVAVALLGAGGIVARFVIGGGI